MKEKKFYYSFFWLSLVAVAVFFFQMFISGYTDMFVLNNLALQGQFWRFLTAIFLHGSGGHLLYNLFALMLFGFILEKIIGTKNFLIVFFGSGILANLVSIFFYPSSLGASGAIYGILGAVIILRPTMMMWVHGALMPMWLAGIVWIVGDVIGIFIPDNIGHIAHLSGIFVGTFIGLMLFKELGQIKKKRQVIELHEPSIRAWEDRYMNKLIFT